MIYPVFCIRDIKVGFGQPAVHMSDMVAKRDFGFKINSPGSIMEYAPSDFELYQVGTFNTDSGKIESQIPEYICNGKDVYGN